MDLTPNPEWEAAPFELRPVWAIASAIQRQRVCHDNLRFRAQDYMAALKAMTEHDSDTLNRLAIRKYIAAG